MRQYLPLSPCSRSMAAFATRHGRLSPLKRHLHAGDLDGNFLTVAAVQSNDWIICSPFAELAIARC